MKKKLGAIGALVGRRFFLSFCYCFRFWFSFSFNSCLHSSSSSSLCYPVVFSVFLFRNRCLKTKMLMREGWLTNVPLCFCFFLSSLVLVTGFLSVSVFFFSSLFSWLSLHSLCLSFFCAGVSVVHVIALVNICYVAITNIHLCQFNFLCIFFFFAMTKVSLVINFIIIFKSYNMQHDSWSIY